MIETCPMCGDEGTFFLCAKDENRRVTDLVFRYLRCARCNTVFIEELPSDLGQYYKGDYYRIPSLEKLASIATRDTCKIDTVLEFISGGRLLEVGPAYGIFALQAKTAGFDVDVIEMDEACCDFLRDNVGVNVTRSDNPHDAIALLPDHDVIALWHVLEHLVDPRGFLVAAAANLKLNGCLVVAMPNPEALQFSMMQHRWPHLDAPRHLALIPASALERVAGELGLRKVYLTYGDSDAQSWNSFGWQRLLMNRFSWKPVQLAMQVLGYAIAILVSPFDRWKNRGAAYTAVFKKVE